MANDSDKNKFSELHKKAQAFLEENPEKAPENADIYQEEVRALVHELDTYQIELELQNEDLRNTRKELEKAHRRYSDFYDFAPVAFITANEKGLILEANLTAGDMLGVSRGQLLKRRLSDFVFPDDQDVFYLRWNKLLETRRQQSFDLRLRRSDETLFHGQLDTVAHSAGSDPPSQFRIIISDISIRKEAELAKIRRMRNRYRAIVMDQSEMICRFDPQGRITFVNDAYCRHFDVNHQDILGTNFLPAIHQDDLPLVQDHFKNLTQSKPDKTIEHRVYLPDGKVHWQQWCGRALYNEAGQIYEYQAVGRDITPLKKAEEKLKKSHDELEKRVTERTLELQESHNQLLHSEKLAAIGNLSASIAHEFNNPLQSVMTIIKGISRYVPMEEKEKEFVALALQECHRMKNLIADLRDFFQPTSDKPTQVDLHAALEALLLLNKKDFHTRSIIAVRKYGHNIPPIMAVADQLKQVFLNLLNNAADACDGGGVVTIITETCDADNVVVHIIDNGIGMSAEDMAHIFEPFFTTKPKTKGTGLGLSVSYGIIKNHGGRIEVKSECNKGSRFSVFLPIESVHHAQ